MNMIVFAVMIATFFVGLLLAFRGIIGKEPQIRVGPRPGQDIYGLPAEGFGKGGVVHPPERHSLRLALIGFALMILAVVFGILFL